jgi:predicted dehydrogenase
VLRSYNDGIVGSAQRGAVNRAPDPLGFQPLSTISPKPKMISSAAPTETDEGECPTIALIGCGAITEALHLPALSRHPEMMLRAICVDPNLTRANEMASKFGAGRAVARYQDVIGELDGAIVAVPPKLHFTITAECLKAQVHVLCEKPLTESGEEARQLVALSKAAGVSLCVNNYRRLYPSSMKVRELIAAGELGIIRHLDFSWGEEFDWPISSGAYFGPAAGRGVLADKGAHVLDLICWWLGGKPQVLSYEDDSMGGTEAVAELRFRFNECEGLVRLSWLSRYPNTFEVRGDRGSVSGGLFDWNVVQIAPATGGRRKIRLPSQAKVPDDVGKVLFDNFLDVIRGRAAPVVTGSDVLPSIELLDECYAARTRLPMPWYDAWHRIAG